VLFQEELASGSYDFEAAWEAFFEEDQNAPFGIEEGPVLFDLFLAEVFLS
jgi:hypothetical protein